MQANGTRAASPEATAGAAAVATFVGALALWTGTTVFYSGVVLPVLFVNMPASQAGSIAALIFPWYFRIGSALGVVATAAALRLARGASGLWRAAAVLLVVMTAAQLYSTLVVHPEVAQLRGNPAAETRFQDLHTLSVRLNAIVLGGGLVLLCASGLLLGRREHRA